MDGKTFFVWGNRGHMSVYEGMDKGGLAPKSAERTRSRGQPCLLPDDLVRVDGLAINPKKRFYSLLPGCSDATAVRLPNKPSFSSFGPAVK